MIFSSTRILSALLYFLALLSLGAAQLAVSNVTVRQRLPRDGKVEITYTLGAVKDVNDTCLTAAVTFTGTDNVTGRTVDVKTLSGAGADGTAVTGSTHTVVWDMAADCPADFHSGSFTVTVAAEVKMPGRYLVVDTEDGTYRLTDQEPDVSDDLCRTRELWLRAIPAGTFTMGSPAGELGRYSGTDSDYNETQHTVKLSNMFFMGIFEVTQGQYGNIGYQNGYPEPHAGAGRPKSGISYHEIRGSVKQWPRNNHTIDLGEDETIEFDDGERFTIRNHASFLDALRYKTGYTLTFDLPTESQWEYACRAGTTGPLNSGERLTDKDVNCKNLAKLARFKGTRKDGKTGYDKDPEASAKVGQYLPNAWGLYDMHGNVREWCLDWMSAYPTKSVNTDPKGGNSGSQRIIRGGGYNGIGARCRSADRWLNTPDERGSGEVGFRVICLPLAGMPVTGEDYQGSAASVPVRLDTRVSLASKILSGGETAAPADGTGFQIDGSATSAWTSGTGILDTTRVADGWHRIAAAGSASAPQTLLFLNSRNVICHDGVLSAGERWSADAVHVIRGMLLVPEGITLEIAAGTIVKILPGGGILSRGQVNCRNAVFTYADDDSRGGDTFMDGAGESAAASYSLSGNFSDDGAVRILPSSHQQGFAPVIGGGDPVTQNFLAPGDNVENVFYFTNDTGAPVQRVRIEFPVDNDFDLNAIKLGRIDVGAAAVTDLMGAAAGSIITAAADGEYRLKVTADCREEQRLLILEISSWDGTTPDEGTLPPEGKGIILKDGEEGFITFSCSVASDLRSPAVLSRAASVSFDGAPAEAVLPAASNLIIPAGGGVPMNTLFWEGAADGTYTVSIWYGPVPDSEEATIVGSWQVTGNSMELPEGLTAGQTYYWQVTGSSYASPIWAFTMDRRLTIAVENGWNLISLPFTITDASAEALSSFQLMKLNKRRIPVKNTAFTAGTYWLYNDGNPARLLFFPAAEQVPEGGVALEAGWNAPAVPEGGAQLKKSETQVFEYRGGLFRKSAADDSGTFTLDAGRGYFIHSFK